MNRRDIESGVRRETDYRSVKRVLLTDDEIEYLEVQTIHTAYCFSREKADGSRIAKWRVLSGRQDVLGKIVHLFGVNQSGKLREVESGGRLGIYCYGENCLSWHTSRILSLAVIVHPKPGVGRLDPKEWWIRRDDKYIVADLEV